MIPDEHYICKFYEKTCRCIRNCQFLSDKDDLCEFISKREYQVDVYYEGSLSGQYKVYINGDYYDFAMMYDYTFNEYFEMIE